MDQLDNGPVDIATQQRVVAKCVWRSVLEPNTASYQIDENTTALVALIDVKRRITRVTCRVNGSMIWKRDFETTSHVQALMWCNCDHVEFGA